MPITEQHIDLSDPDGFLEAVPHDAFAAVTS
jgi:hypothetical protein